MVPAGKHLLAPTHSDDHYEETVYGMDGVITFTVNGVSTLEQRRAGYVETAREHERRRWRSASYQ